MNPFDRGENLATPLEFDRSADAEIWVRKHRCPICEAQPVIKFSAGRKFRPECPICNQPMFAATAVTVRRTEQAKNERAAIMAKYNPATESEAELLQTLGF